MSTTTTALDLSLLPSEADVQFFQEHGWWISPRILTDEEIEDAQYGLQRYYAGERDAALLVDAGTDWTEARGNVLRQNDYVSLQIEEFSRLVRHPLIGASAAMLARTTEVRLFHDQLLYKPPSADADRTTVGWHTDIAYWQTCSSRSLVSAWMPLQTCTEDMGPMVVMDGSHRWEGNDNLQSFHETAMETIEARIRKPAADVKVIPMALSLGQVSFHHCRTVHGSYPNRTTEPRIAFAIHMQGADNAFVRRLNAAGRPASHINDLLCRKTADGDPDYTDPDVFPVLWRAGAANPFA